MIFYVSATELPQLSFGPRYQYRDELAGVHLVLTKIPAKNVILAPELLAPYPDMALGSGRSHMNRCEIICILYQTNFLL